MKRKIISCFCIGCLLAIIGLIGVILSSKFIMPIQSKQSFLTLLYYLIPIVLYAGLIMIVNSVLSAIKLLIAKKKVSNN